MRLESICRTNDATSMLRLPSAKYGVGQLMFYFQLLPDELLNPLRLLLGAI